MVWSCATKAGMAWLANFTSPCASMRVCIHLIDEPNSKKAKTAGVMLASRESREEVPQLCWSTVAVDKLEYKQRTHQQR